ncbi:MAG TPA: Hsp70 family protein, partial [Isosphaeraceae bacterium]|nr:Hsp70 family protein [Isosphaeraceae bacterium]
DEVQRIVTPEGAAEGEPGSGHFDGIDEEELEKALDEIERTTGYTLTGPVRELVGTQIVNVLSKGLGVVARNAEGAFEVVYLLPRNGEVPMEKSTDFGTDIGNQDAVEIKVVAGEGASTAPEDANEVGTATLNLPADLPAKSPIRVKFSISRDGRLTMTATDLTGGGSIDVEFETEAVMNAEQIAERSTALSLLNVS